MDMRQFETLRSAGVDTEEALRRFAGNAELYRHFLERFAEDENFQKLSEAISREDWEEALRAAHTLKGVSGNLGMMRLYAACDEIVRLLRENDRAGARETSDELREAYQAVLEALEQA